MPCVPTRVLELTLCCALLLVLACGGSSGGGDEPCNGQTELCERRYSEVAFAGAHNAMSNEEDGFFAANQRYGVARALEDGIRVLLLDTHYWQDELYLCHSVCELGARPLAETLADIAAFMAANPREVVTIIFQDGISVEDTVGALEAAGLAQRAYAHEQGEAWPTLAEMIDAGTTLVVTAESQGPPPAWYLHAWDVMWDTPYTFESIEAFTCRHNRGSTDNDLFLLNHWVQNPISNAKAAAQANAYDVLLQRALECWEENPDNTANQIPNFVTVDWYDEGDVFGVVDELNRRAGLLPQ